MKEYILTMPQCTVIWRWWCFQIGIIGYYRFSNVKPSPLVYTTMANLIVNCIMAANSYPSYFFCICISFVSSVIVLFSQQSSLLNLVEHTNIFSLVPCYYFSCVWYFWYFYSIFFSVCFCQGWGILLLFQRFQLINHFRNVTILLSVIVWISFTLCSLGIFTR